jgi:hypothetical protein
MNQARRAHVRHHTDRSHSTSDEIYAQHDTEDDENITAMRFYDLINTSASMMFIV